MAEDESDIGWVGIIQTDRALWIGGRPADLRVHMAFRLLTTGADPFEPSPWDITPRCHMLVQPRCMLGAVNFTALDCS